MTTNQNQSPMTQIEALLAQSAAISKFQLTGEMSHAQEAARLAKISGVEIGPHGEIVPMLNATYVTAIKSENTGGGCMVDFLTMSDGRVLCLNDEAVCVYATEEAFFEEGDNPQHMMWITTTTDGATPDSRQSLLSDPAG